MCRRFMCVFSVYRLLIENGRGTFCFSGGSGGGQFPAAGGGYLNQVCSLSCPQPPENCPVSFPYLSL